MFKKIRSTKGFTLVELMIVVAIIGILAALAIPAFVQYLKNAKTAEVGGIMSTMADGARSYYEGDQQFSNEDGTWHEATEGDPNERPGMPVGFDDKVFPGFETSLQTSAEFPVGGGQIMPSIVPASDTGDLIARTMNLDVREALYFGYNYVPAGSGNGAEADFHACHGFKMTGAGATTDCVTDYADAHMVSQSCFVDNDGVSCDPRFTENEFE